MVVYTPNIWTVLQNIKINRNESKWLNAFKACWFKTSTACFIEPLYEKVTSKYLNLSTTSTISLLVFQTKLCLLFYFKYTYFSCINIYF